MNERNGNWASTFTGRAFFAMDPRVEDICIADIAHAHSLDGRWGGHSKYFFSVAQHCVLASYIEPNFFPLEKLLHDSPEAYLRDLPRPLKIDPRFAAYREAERVLGSAIATRFGLPDRFWELPAVTIADEIMAATEWRDVMGPPPRPRGRALPPPRPELITPWPPLEAERRFLLRFAELTGEDVSDDIRRAADAANGGTDVRGWAFGEMSTVCDDLIEALRQIDPAHPALRGARLRASIARSVPWIDPYDRR